MEENLNSIFCLNVISISNFMSFICVKTAILPRKIKLFFKSKQQSEHCNEDRSLPHTQVMGVSNYACLPQTFLTKDALNSNGSAVDTIHLRESASNAFQYLSRAVVYSFLTLFFFNFDAKLIFFVHL